MEHYAGIDVSLELSSVCVVDASWPDCARGQAGERAGGADWLVARARPWLARIGLEAGPLSQWLFAGDGEADLPVELLETRHVRDAFKTMPVKTDRKDARGIAQLMRLGWFRPVHCKSASAQEMRALLTARKLLQAKQHDMEMSLRGVLRGFGLKVGPTTPRTFAGAYLRAGGGACRLCCHRRGAACGTRELDAQFQGPGEAAAARRVRRAGAAADDRAGCGRASWR